MQETTVYIISGKDRKLDIMAINFSAVMLLSNVIQSAQDMY